MVWKDEKAEELDDELPQWKNIWKPKLIFKNKIGKLTTLSKCIDKLEKSEQNLRPRRAKDCNVQMVYNIQCEFREMYQLQYFPLDRQFVSIRIVYDIFSSKGFTDVVFLDATTGVGIDGKEWHRPMNQFGTTINKVFAHRVNTLRRWSWSELYDIILHTKKHKMKLLFDMMKLSKKKEKEQNKYSEQNRTCQELLKKLNWDSTMFLDDKEFKRVERKVRAQMKLETNDKSAEPESPDEEILTNIDNTDMDSESEKFWLHKKTFRGKISRRMDLDKVAKLYSTIALVEMMDDHDNYGNTKDIQCFVDDWKALNPGQLRIQGTDSLMNAPNFLIICKLERQPDYYMYNVTLVMTLLVCLSTASLTMPSMDDIGDRIETNLTLLLTAVAYKYIVNSFLPPTPYLTLLDIYVICCFLVLGLVTVASALSNHLVEDPYYYNWCIFIFVLSYGLISLIFIGITLRCPNCLRPKWSSPKTSN